MINAHLKPHLSPCLLRRSPSELRQTCSSGSPGIWGRREGRPGARADLLVLRSTPRRRRWEARSQLCPTAQRRSGPSLGEPRTRRRTVPLPSARGRRSSTSSTRPQRQIPADGTTAPVSQVPVRRRGPQSLRAASSSRLLFPAPKGRAGVRVSRRVQLAHWSSCVAGGQWRTRVHYWKGQTSVVQRETWLREMGQSQACRTNPKVHTGTFWLEHIKSHLHLHACQHNQPVCSQEGLFQCGSLKQQTERQPGSSPP